MLRFACIVLVAGLAACETPKSYIEIPACADRIEVEGQATRLSKSRFELDHTFDLPFSRTVLDITTPDGERSFEIIDSQPDPLRLFVGAGSTVVGALFLASAGFAAATGQDASQPIAAGIAGGVLVAAGGAAMATGWHPPGRVFRFPSDACPGGAAPRAAEKKGPHGGRVYER